MDERLSEHLTSRLSFTTEWGFIEGGRTCQVEGPTEGSGLWGVSGSVWEPRDSRRGWMPGDAGDSTGGKAGPQAAGHTRQTYCVFKAVGPGETLKHTD